MGQQKDDDITDEELVRQADAKGIPWRRQLREQLAGIRPPQRGGNHVARQQKALNELWERIDGLPVVNQTSLSDREQDTAIYGIEN